MLTLKESNEFVKINTFVYLTVHLSFVITSRCAFNHVSAKPVYGCVRTCLR